jgi:hypothetical protein
MDLVSLAPEPFEEVISYLNPQEWILLWISGDPRIIWRLGKGKAVRKMAIHWTLGSPCSWPSLISVLEGLESFSFRSAHKAQGKRPSAHHLASLNRNLKRMTFHSNSALAMLKDICSAYPDHFHNLESLRISSSSAPSRLDFLFPQTLTSLEIFSLDGTCISLTLPLLPPCLVRLSCAVKRLEIGDSKFPTTLQSLCLVTDSMQSWPFIFHLLPVALADLTIKAQGQGSSMREREWTSLSSLTNLKSLNLNVHGPFGVNEAQSIPRSVTDLKLQHVLETRAEEWAIEILKSLPKTIRNLGGILPIRICSIELAQSLPCTLENISEYEVAPQVVAYLPNSISNMTLGLNEDDSLLSTFPSNLRHLHIFKLSDSLLQRLPNHLQTLTIFGTSTRLNKELAQLLPRNLTQLEFLLVYNPLENTELFQALPSTLTCLAANSPLALPSRMIPVQTSATSSLEFQRAMKKLDIGCLDFNNGDFGKWILGLTTTLTSLSLTINRAKKADFQSFGNLPFLSILTLALLNVPKGGWAGFLDFSSLPVCLEQFSLYSLGIAFQHSDISNNTFKGAPHFLKSLIVPSSPLVNKACLVHLRNLERFSFNVGQFCNMVSWFHE